MSAVLLAVFNRFEDAERVRTRLVQDGFPTDRVELTATTEKGRAGLQPASTAESQFLQSSAPCSLVMTSARSPSCSPAASATARQSRSPCIRVVT